MCGVLGIKGQLEIDAAQSLLQLLVHRGQDASGLSWVDPYNVHQSSKIKDSPSEIRLPKNEEASVVIGSTRYPTLGDRKGDIAEKKFAQPFSFQTSKGTLSLCHNGNITNLGELSDDPKQFASDAEFITQRLGQLINEYEDLEPALQKLVGELDGAYSIVGILGTEMFAFRDPRGIRPLVYGTNGIHYIASSESLVLQQAGVLEYKDVKPGELVYFEPNQIQTKQLVDPEKISHCFFEYVYFASSISTIDGRNVYHTRLSLGQKLANQLRSKGINKQVDIVIPVPDTSKAASQTIAEELGLPFREGIMKNRSSNRTFIMPTEDMRERAARSKYLFVDKYLQQRDILLVDDSIVRGLTMKFLIEVLKERGANNIHVAITCPPPKYACYYGVDFGSDKELIAKDQTEEEICQEIGADSLTYITINNLKEAIQINDLCDACITGNYPTPYGKNIREKVDKGLIELDSTHYE